MHAPTSPAPLRRGFRRSVGALRLPECVDRAPDDLRPVRAAGPRESLEARELTRRDGHGDRPVEGLHAPVRPSSGTARAPHAEALRVTRGGHVGGRTRVPGGSTIGRRPPGAAVADDRALDVEPSGDAHTVRHGHVAGVLMLEALAQAAAVLGFETHDITPDDKTIYYFAGIDGVRFKRPVEPGDQLILDVSVARMRAGIWKFDAKALVGEVDVIGSRSTRIIPTSPPVAVQNRTTGSSVTGAPGATRWTGMPRAGRPRRPAGRSTTSDQPGGLRPVTPE